MEAQLVNRLCDRCRRVLSRYLTSCRGPRRRPQGDGGAAGAGERVGGSWMAGVSRPAGDLKPWRYPELPRRLRGVELTRCFLQRALPRRRHRRRSAPRGSSGTLLVKSEL